MTHTLCVCGVPCGTRIRKQQSGKRMYVEWFLFFGVRLMNTQNQN